jgi:hypothetical protein
MFNEVLKEIQGLSEANRVDLGKEFKLSPKQCSSPKDFVGELRKAGLSNDSQEQLEKLYIWTEKHLPRGKLRPLIEKVMRQNVPSSSVLEGDDAVLEMSELKDEEEEAEGEGEEKEQQQDVQEERKLRRSSSAEEKQEILKILEDLKLIKYWSMLKEFTVPALRGISVLEMKEHLGIPLPDGLAIYRVLHPGSPSVRLQPQAKSTASPVTSPTRQHRQRALTPQSLNMPKP